MNTPENRVGTCMRCQHVGKASAGVQRCEYQNDGENIVDHAVQNKCPAGIYGSLSLAKEDPTSAIIEHIRKGKVTRSGWENWPSTREAHRILMREFLPTIPVQQLGTEAIIGHVYHHLNLIAHPDHYRCQTAMRTWGGLGVRLLPFTPMRTAASELGDPRAIPFFRDLFDYAAENADLICWSNLDACLYSGAYGAIRDHLKTHGAYYSGRVAVADAQNPIDPKWESGIDLIAMKSEWWRSHRNEMPDCVIAAEGGDWCMGKLIKQEWPGVESLPPILYHETHRVYWHTKRFDPASIHNRKHAREFAAKIGLPPDTIESEEGLGSA